MKFAVGDFVGVPAIYAPGAFSDEMMVTINNGADLISGFVQRANIVRFVDDRNAFVKAKVVGTDSVITLKLFGSFFTTNGIEPFQADWASKNLNRAEAA